MVKFAEPYIQILHVDPLHWVCVADTSKQKFDNTKANLYDSLASETVCYSIAKQVAAFSFCTTSSELVIHTMDVHQQPNSKDCGVFSIAFATSLAFGVCPTELRFDVPNLRNHLLQCLEEGRFRQFPYTATIKPTKLKSSVVELYCHCRMPYNKRDHKDMIECSKCFQWYHVECEEVNDAAMKNLKAKWLCKTCK